MFLVTNENMGLCLYIFQIVLDQKKWKDLFYGHSGLTNMKNFDTKAAIIAERSRACVLVIRRGPSQVQSRQRMVGKE